MCCVCQADRTVEAGIIEAAVIKAVLIVLIGVINVLRVKLLTHSDMHMHTHLAQTCIPTRTQLFGLWDTFPVTVDDTYHCINSLPTPSLHNYILSLGIITDEK